MTQTEAVTVATGQYKDIRHRPNATEKPAKSLPVAPSDTTEAALWHIERRKKILKEFPEIASLEQPYPTTSLWCITVVVALWATTFLCGYLRHWQTTAILAFLVGTPLDRGVFSLCHEVCHSLIHRRLNSKRAKRWCMRFLCSSPSARYFSYYTAGHLTHHSALGGTTLEESLAFVEADEPFDMDVRPQLVNMVIESRKEGNYISPATGLGVQKSYAHLVFSKLLGMFAGELIMKPLMIARKCTGANILTPPDPFPKGAPKFLVDDIIQEASGLLMLYVACQLLSLSFLHGWLFCFLTKAYDELALHPFAAYFLITHMSVFGKDSCQPTMSTYGSSLISALYFNVNYHVEHHDFPRVPWVHLPKITAIGGKWYSELKSETFLSAYLRLLRPGSGDTWVYGCHTPEVRKA